MSSNRPVPCIITWEVVMENPIAHAARLATMQHPTTPNQQKAETMPEFMPTSAQQPTKQPKTKGGGTRVHRTLTAGQAIMLGDWLRRPPNIEKCRTYVEVADAANKAGAVPGFEVSPRSCQNIMEAFGLALERKRGRRAAASQHDAVLRKLADIVIKQLEMAMQYRQLPQDYVVQFKVDLQELKKLLGE